MEPVTSEKDSHNVEFNSNLDGNPIESYNSEKNIIYRILNCNLRTDYLL